MAKRTKSELKNYFEAGKRPTESQFEDFIDSYAHLDDTRIRELHNSEYTVNLQFPADYQVGDYVEFVGFYPEMSLASGFYEISVAYTRGNIASAATHIASVSHANSNIWRECGRINTNNYVGYANGDCFTIDAHGSLYRFRIRATRVLGDPSSNMSVVIKVRSINKNLSWNEMDNRGNDSSTIPLQPMTDQWEILTGSAFSTAPAKVALKADMNGNVGIGTRTPEVQLHVFKQNSSNQNLVTAKFVSNGETGGSNIIRLSYHNSVNLELNSGYSSNGFRYGSHFDFNIQNDNYGNIGHGAINFITSNKIQMSIKPNGNVGVGTSNPSQKLSIVGNQGLNEGAPTNGQNSSALLRVQSNGTGNGEVMDFGMNVQPSYGWIQPQDLNNSNAFYNLLLNPKGGNVGIGTQNPDHKLTVKGKIHAEDVIVDMNVPADYVFQKYYDNHSSIREDYSMMNLNELEAFIKENKHLPEIPSGEKMTQDGVTLGDFQMKLLQKIEELTLYAISQNKEIEQLKSQINKQ
ncbi:hypothetical protein LNP04_12285 [Chryseobacterium sp. C-71]|uniref:hypothetical protein n=1 Tax=Chryseobacterium sp. C-71 TaxID=2893882 RepID=UPI001E3F2652|nr:hypothetical protein [Chryseobacterium sp. C-71]UFH30753.1 hypothetical protein LNP04_12285 [Chryseobacterium sp. C-71]